MELFKIFGTIALNNSEANRGIDETASKGEELKNKLSSTFSKVGSAAVKGGKVIAAGLAAGATAMGALTTKALNAAGELEQNMGGSEAVFKQCAGKMQKTAKSAFKNMGVSASDFLANANKMGALFQGAGFDIEESADMSASALQRAADVASIMGISLESAMESVAGAAKGNFTMMDNLGVAINDTTLQTYAWSKGIDKATKDMTTQEKVGLAMELFMEKTAYATGNYAKENETLAGALDTAKAAFSNFLSGAGDVDDLVGAFVNAGRVIIDNLNTLLPRLVSGVTELINQLMPYLPELIQSVLPGIIQGAVALLQGLITALPTILQILIEQFPSIMAQLGSALANTFPIFMETVRNLFGQLWDYISLELLNTGVSFEDALTKAGEVFGAAWEVMQVLWDSIGRPIWDAIQFAIGEVQEIFAQYMPAIMMFFQSAIAGMKDSWENHLKPALQAIGDFLNKHLKPAFQLVFDVFIRPLVKNTFEAIRNLWNGTLKPVFDNVCDFLKNVFTGNWKKAFQNILNIVTSIFSGICNLISSKMEFAKNVVNNAINKIKGFFNFEWSLPNLKLPHPRISGSFSLNPPSVPTFGIDWYGKAMRDPMIMESPTMFGINSMGEVMAGGEKGSEVVSGTDTLMNLIAQAVASQNGVLAQTMAEGFMNIIELLQEYLPQLASRQLVLDSGAVVGGLAEEIDYRLGKLAYARERGL